jgi:phosphate transport system substrate-binding protein
MKRVVLLAFLFGFLMTGCMSRSNAPLAGTGSTLIFPVMEKWVSQYQQAKGVKVTYESVGSHAGVQRLSPGVFDFACTDVPLTDDQIDKARHEGGDVVQVPLVLGAVVPAYNLEEIKEPLTFSGPVLADIYLGKIHKWNEKVIQDLNPNVTLPDKDIAVFHRKDGSGTTYIWTDYLARVSPEWKKTVGAGTSVSWQVGEGASSNKELAESMKKKAGSIGYLPLTYALDAQIPFGLVQNKEGTAVKPSMESVTAAAKAILPEIGEDLRFSLANAPGKDSYPISGATWAVVFAHQSGASGQTLADFLRWATHDGQEAAKSLKYAPLPSELAERVEKKLTAIQVRK